MAALRLPQWPQVLSLLAVFLSLCGRFAPSTMAAGTQFTCFTITKITNTDAWGPLARQTRRNRAALLALLVLKYKYWRLKSAWPGIRTASYSGHRILSLLHALLVQKYTY